MPIRNRENPQACLSFMRMRSRSRIILSDPALHDNVTGTAVVPLTAGDSAFIKAHTRCDGGLAPRSWRILLSSLLECKSRRENPCFGLGGVFINFIYCSDMYIVIPSWVACDRAVLKVLKLPPFLSWWLLLAAGHFVHDLRTLVRDHSSHYGTEGSCLTCSRGRS